jgi:hypothetical protein
MPGFILKTRPTQTKYLQCGSGRERMVFSREVRAIEDRHF